MPREEDLPKLYLSFEEFERDELRRAEAMGGGVEHLFDGMFGEDAVSGPPSASPWRYDVDEGDDEEE
jgi:hypothetical protein